MKEKHPSPQDNEDHEDHDHDERNDHDARQCRELFARMSEYLDQELDEHAIPVFEEHLRDCPACRTCLSTLARTVAFCHALPSPRPHETFSLRLRAMLTRLSSP